MSVIYTDSFCSAKLGVFELLIWPHCHAYFPVIFGKSTYQFKELGLWVSL
jgi:hypothetical protein